MGKFEFRRNWAFDTGNPLVDHNTLEDWAGSPAELAVLQQGLLDATANILLLQGQVTALQDELDGRLSEEALLSSRPGVISHVENATNVATNFAASAAIVEHMVLIVPPTDKSVWIEWGCTMGISGGSGGVSQGVLQSSIFEVTTSLPVPIAVDAVYSRVEDIDPAVLRGPNQRSSTPVGRADHLRLYCLYAQAFREGGGASLNGYVRNAGAGARTFMTAVAR